MVEMESDEIKQKIEKLEKLRNAVIVAPRGGDSSSHAPGEPREDLRLLTTGLLCPDMKKTTLDSVVRIMGQRRNVVKVREEVRVKAELALDRMLEVS
ncbi:unnamed protein product [marine sediment metagenome]|uniref:Uncharacterized protein n=1 Tax=marine sediment metagenome TaxID=412755 RepID=X0T2L3_9ZZZZ